MILALAVAVKNIKSAVGNNVVDMFQRDTHVEVIVGIQRSDL